MIQLFKKTSIILLVILIVLAAQPSIVAHAAPPAPIEITLYQPDGFAFQARAWGDEWSNGMETLDGYTILQDGQSLFWVYAAEPTHDSLRPSTLIVGRDDPAAAGLPLHLRPNVNRPAGSPPAGFQPIPEDSINVGTQRVLVLLAQFQNQPSLGTDAAYWNDRIFGPALSVKKYYKEVSYGQLNLLPAIENYGTSRDGIVGWITLPYNHPNSGGNVSDHNRQITRDAILASAPYVDYTVYDTNNDGYISNKELHIIVVVAGYETAFASTSSCKPGIWAHYWGFEGGKVPAPVVYGKTIGEISAGGGYVQVGEWHCADLPGLTPGYPATMGVIAHEFGHSLNLPDLYDTGGGSSGIGVWGIMGMGTWNTTGTQLGDLPAHHDAWSKWYEGWITPLQLRGLSAGQPIPQAESNPTVFQLLDNPNGLDWKFKSNSGTGEYFLVENRQQTGFDAGLPGCGLLIWHIDESVPFDNSANAGNPRRLVYLVQADGTDELGRGRDTGDAGDPFPGSRWRQAFSASTTPNSNLYDGSPSSVNVLNISGCASTMTADFLTPGDGTFADIAPDYWAVDSIEKLYQNGITQGCGVYPLIYCPESSTTRAQMAIFLLRSKHGSSYTPPAATGTAFADVPADHWAAAWIEQLVTEGITAGCGDGNYCPESEVTRAQMAVFLLRSKYGGSYTPPAATGTAFTDVPADYWAAAWIEQLVAEGITTGCGDGNYCPESAVTRAQMAVFLVKTFALP